MKKVGYWYSKEEPKLPMPVQQGPDSEWVLAGRPAAFAKLLNIVERLARCRGFKGSSKCRICGKRNGSMEYSYKGWMWPEGYMHYIKDHNVRPPMRFVAFVVSEITKAKGLKNA